MARKDDLAKERRKQTDEQNAEAMKRTERVRPTPTQEEIDRAKLGVESLDELDKKEKDGSEEEEVDQAPSRSAMTYQTRDAEPSRTSDSSSKANK